MIDTDNYSTNYQNSQQTVNFSVNRSGRNKHWDYEKLTAGFKNATGTVEDVLAAVKSGYAINGAWFNGRRSKSNVVGVQLLLVDIDNTAYQLDSAGQPVKDSEGRRIPIYSGELTIEDALAHPFVQKYCAFMYTTASHKPEWHKLRLGFVLPEVVDRATYEALASIVLEKFPHDPACKDAGRVFFGNSNTEIILCNPNAVLDSSSIEAAKIKQKQDAIAKAERERQQKLRREELRHDWESSGRTERDLEALVREALTHIPPRQKGSGNYDDCLKILTALRNEFGDSLGTEIAEQWSPPSAKDGWFPARKRTNNSNIGIGTVFYLAQQNGWQFPELPQRERRKLAKRIGKQEYQERFTLPRVIKLVGNRIKSLKNKRFKAYGFSQEQIEHQQRDLAASRARDLSQPNYYKKYQRLDTWSKSQRKYIADSSATGTGKSFDSGRAEPNIFGAQQIFYVTSDPRNVTTETLKEGWKVCEGRHDGLVEDRHGKIRRAKGDENEKIVDPGNCMRTETIAALSKKNIERANSAELICGGCPQSGLCHSGVRYKNIPTGYLGDRKSALANKKIIIHPSSLPSPENFDYSKATLIWDEWSTILTNTKQIEVWQEDLKEIMVHLVTQAPELVSQLSPLLRELDQIFDGKAPTRFGWNNATLTERLKPVLPKELDWEALAQATEPNLDALNPTKEYGCDIQDLPKSVKKLMTDPDHQTAKRIETETIKQWILTLLKILSGETVGYLSKSGGLLTITITDTRLTEIARAAQKNIFMDATGHISDLAALLDVSVGEISHIAASPGNKGASVKYIQVAGLGRLGQQRGNHQKHQTAAITKALQEKHPGIRKIAFKSFAAGKDLRWFVESRGANDAEKDMALILEGIPTPNIEALKAEFTCLHGRVPEPGTEKVKYKIDLTNKGLPSSGSPYLELNSSSDREFREFVRRKVLAAIRQAIGRLRANRRSGEELIIYILGDYPLDFPVKLVRARDITPEAASKMERFEMALQGAIAQLLAEGQKVTQTALAQITGYSQGYISRFKKLLLSLLESFNSKSNNSDPPPEEVQWLAREYFPHAVKEQLPEEIYHFLQAYGEREFRLLFDLLSQQQKQDLIYWLLAAQSDSVINGLAEVVS